MFRFKKLIEVKLDIKSIKKGIKEKSCRIVAAFPENMPEEEKEDIKQRINSIIDDIRKYL